MDRGAEGTVGGFLERVVVRVPLNGNLKLGASTLLGVMKHVSPQRSCLDRGGGEVQI